MNPSLTHWPREPNIGVNVIDIIGPRNGQVGANPFLEPMMNSHREKAKEQSYVKYLY